MVFFCKWMSGYFHLLADFVLTCFLTYFTSMIVNTLLSCFRAMSYRMFPIFPQLQVALPSIQHSPFAIMNQREETRKQSFTEWLNDNYIMWAAPKKRVWLLLAL